MVRNSEPVVRLNQALRVLRSAVVLMGAAAVVACGGVSAHQNASSEPMRVGQGPANSVEASMPNPAHTLTISSKILGEARQVYVQLPAGYARSQNRYPVLVVMDGEWLFELAQAQVMFRLASAQDDKEQAIAIIDRLLAYEPDASLAHFYKGRFRHSLERDDEALESYREALAAELRNEAPLGLRLRWYRDAIDEIADIEQAEDKRRAGA